MHGAADVFLETGYMCLAEHDLPNSCPTAPQKSICSPSDAVPSAHDKWHTLQRLVFFSGKVTFLLVQEQGCTIGALREVDNT